MARLACAALTLVAVSPMAYGRHDRKRGAIEVFCAITLRWEAEGRWCQTGAVGEPAPVAERMRQRTSNPYHAGSSPAGGALPGAPLPGARLGPGARRVHYRGRISAGGAL